MHKLGNTLDTGLGQRLGLEHGLPCPFPVHNYRLLHMILYCYGNGKISENNNVDLKKSILDCQRAWLKPL